MTVPRVPTFALYLATWLGGLGLLASLAVHALTFTDTAFTDGVFVLHGGVFVAFFPVVFGLLGQLRAEGVDVGDRRAANAAMWRLFRSIPGPGLALIGVLFVYAMANFLIGFAAAEGEGEHMVRMFSGHWMAFYAGAAVLGHRLLRLRQEAEVERAGR